MKHVKRGKIALNDLYHCKGHPNVRHTDNNCNGQIASDGEGWVDLPEGFGFPDGSSDFVVDCKRYKTYQGFCMKCQTSGTFIRTDKKPRSIRRKPRKLNARLRSGR